MPPVPTATIIATAINNNPAIVKNHGSGLVQQPPANPPSYFEQIFGWMFSDLPITAGQQVVEVFWLCLILAALLGFLGIIRLVVLARPLLVTLILRLSLLSLIIVVSSFLFRMGEWPTATTLALVWILLVSRWWSSFRPAAVAKAWRYQPPGFRLMDWARSLGIRPGASRHAKSPPHSPRRRSTGWFRPRLPSLREVFSLRLWMRWLGKLLLMLGSLLTGLARAIEREQKAAAAKNANRAGAHQAKPTASSSSQTAPPPKPSRSPPPSPPPPKPSRSPPPPPPPPPKGGMSQAEALKLLGLPQGASLEQIRAAHRRLMIRYHPDHGGDAKMAARINQAKDVLLGR
ncbi:MAG: DnaJ domain-containing protein [Holosporaceae bacterium]